ncbi:invasion protein IalB [Bradyrhizobium sp. AZCC 1719]|uniref:invasion associated locus B family protein n=1 Tax=Bradyrhizobium sp. AZCC 1719 TaxID=3117028 RepID=UPI002FEFE733
MMSRSAASLIWLASILLAAMVDEAVAQQPVSSPRPVQTPTVQQPTPPAMTLPNGASSINETYGDWTVDCRIANNQKQCLLSHAQGNNQTGQRIFAIELRPPSEGKTEGAILMPFGLNLDSGAILKLDDKDLGKGLRFSTCVPQGCLLPVSFPAAATDAMRKAGKLVVASLNLSSGDAVTFNVSLNGFGTALDRMTQLASR